MALQQFPVLVRYPHPITGRGRRIVSSASGRLVPPAGRARESDPDARPTAVRAPHGRAIYRLVDFHSASDEVAFTRTHARARKQQRQEQDAVLQ
eukprot:226269-Prymnesium_polylepis.1